MIHSSSHSSAKVLPLRRLALLATTVAALAVGGLVAAPCLLPYASPALAQDHPATSTW